MAIAFTDIKEGDAIPSIKKDPITQVQLIRYAGAAGDFNPIHTVPSYAKEAGLPGNHSPRDAHHGHSGTVHQRLGRGQAGSQI
jgi:acyl dehydratase